MVFYISQETQSDTSAVEALFDLCFSPGRIALSSYRLRDGIDPVPQLCRLARDELGNVAGAVRYWPVCVGDEPALLLGPIAVHPTRQGEGLGAMLMDDTLSRAEGLGWDRVVLVGDAPYYKRFGFERLNGVEMPPPTNPDRILGIAVTPGAWEGVSGQVVKMKG